MHSRKGAIISMHCTYNYKVRKKMGGDKASDRTQNTAFFKYMESTFFHMLVNIKNMES